VIASIGKTPVPTPALAECAEVEIEADRNVYVVYGREPVWNSRDWRHAASGRDWVRPGEPIRFPWANGLRVMIATEAPETVG
jgi:hypothetical protein